MATRSQSSSPPSRLSHRTATARRTTAHILTLHDIASDRYGGFRAEPVELTACASVAAMRWAIRSVIHVHSCAPLALACIHTGAPLSVHLYVYKPNARACKLSPGVPHSNWRCSALLTVSSVQTRTAKCRSKLTCGLTKVSTTDSRLLSARSRYCHGAL